MEQPPSECAGSYDGDNAKSEDAVTGKRHRKVIVLIRMITFPSTSVGFSRVTESAETLAESDPLTQSDIDEDCYDWEFQPGDWKSGGCKSYRSTGTRKKPKTSPRKMLLARHSLDKKQRKTKENIQINAQARKENNELRLKRRHIQRLGLDLYYRRTDEQYSGRSKKPSRVTAPRGYVPHKQRRRDRQDHPSALLYELKHDDISDDFSRLLVELQHRDLTPEDYETLLRLDDKVTPKTLSQSALSSFTTLTLESTSSLTGQLCSICMDVYSVSQRVKTLPCTHTFHCSCIDAWLSSASLNCPLDGIPVHS